MIDEYYSKNIYDIINDNIDINDNIYKIFDNVENKLYCKIYNKQKIINRINMNNIVKLISENSIIMVDYNNMFSKEGLGFSIFFDKYKINIMYKQILITLENIDDIRNELITIYPSYYVNTIISIITNMINLDKCFIYNLSNIDNNYLKLIEYKCKKNSSIYYFDNIIINKINKFCIEKYNNNLLDRYLKDDNTIRLIISDKYITNEDILQYFVDICTLFDNINYFVKNESELTMNFKSMLNMFDNTKERILKYYLIYKMYIFININFKILYFLNNLKNCIINKSEEFKLDIQKHNVDYPSILINNLYKQLNYTCIQFNIKKT